MDVRAGEGVTLPGIRLHNQPVQVMPNQKKVKARRKRRKELVLIQICLFGGLLLVVKGCSGFSGNLGENLDVVLEPSDPVVMLALIELGYSISCGLYFISLIQ